MLNKLNDPKITHLLMRKYNGCVAEVVKLKKYVLPHDRSFYVSMVLWSRDINMAQARSAAYAEKPMPYEVYTRWGYERDVFVEVWSKPMTEEDYAREKKRKEYLAECKKFSET